MNKVFIIGRLTKDPEIRSTSTGKKVASFSLAVNEGKDSNGQEIVQFFEFSAWDRLAEICELYVKRGARVAVVGSLKNRSWDKPDGTKGRATDILVRELELLSSRNDSSEANTGSNINNSTPSTKKPTSKDEDDIDGGSNQLPEINVDDIKINMPF